MAELPPQAKLRTYIVQANRSIADGIFELDLYNADDPIPMFQAGQWVGLHLLETDGSEWARAAYSIASAPSDGVHTITLVIKLEGDFTKRASTLVSGDRVQLQGPFGTFTIKSDAKQIVLLAGGIGITPMLSMIREVFRSNSAAPNITLFYSCKREAEVVYLPEFQELASRHPSFTFHCTCTRDVSDGWTGGRSRIDEAMLDTLISDDMPSEYYLCGPREFMDSMTTILHHRGVQNSQIHKELFS